MAVFAPGDDPYSPDAFNAAFGGSVPMPTPTPTPGVSLSGPGGQANALLSANSAPTGAWDNIYSGVNKALIGAHNWFGSGQQKPVSKKIMDQVNSPMNFQNTPGLGYSPGGANTNVNAPIAPANPPGPTALAPPIGSPAPAVPPMRPPPQAQQQQQGAPQATMPPAWASGMTGMAPNMDDAMLGMQMQGGGGGGPPQGALAAPGAPPSSPFTMVLRPNAPANDQGGRGGGGPALSTALDLSGWRPQAPPAPPSINLGYGGGGQTPTRPAAVSPRARAQAPDPGSQFWSTSGPGVGFPAAKGPGFWAVQGPGIGLPAAKGPGFWSIQGPGVGFPSPGPVNQPGFWGVHGRGVGF
jgi:hypothetical protein